jgi:PhnB protein
MRLNPYISFHRNAREAMTYYQSVLGGDLVIDTFATFDGMVADPSDKDLVMHSQLTTSDGIVLMGADTPSEMPYTAPAGVSMSVSSDDESRIAALFSAFAADGTVTLPFDTQVWGAKFGMVTDRFGIGWMFAVIDN